MMLSDMGVKGQRPLLSGAERTYSSGGFWAQSGTKLVAIRTIPDETVILSRTNSGTPIASGAQRSTAIRSDH